MKPTYMKQKPNEPFFSIAKFPQSLMLELTSFISVPKASSLTFTS